jgi:hypothetical protein
MFFPLKFFIKVAFPKMKLMLVKHLKVSSVSSHKQDINNKKSSQVKNKM